MINSSPEMILAVFIGLALGSFATALTWRIPRGRSWIASGGRAEHSACPSCAHRLSWKDLVPLFSWIFLAGKCRYCRALIGWKYPVIELATLVACVLCYLVMGFSVPGIVLMAAVPFLVAMTAIDLKHMILPDQINFILGVLGLIFVYATNAGQGEIWGPVFQGLVVAGGYAFFAFAISWSIGKILKKDVMGMGDVKFFAVAGLWMGPEVLPAFLMLAGFGGLVIGLLWKILVKTEAFPFGPALIMSFFVCLLLKSQIMGLLY